MDGSTTTSHDEDPFESDPNYTEIRTIFQTEDSQPDIWRRTQAGESPEEIRVALGNEYPTFVWNYLRTARAILDGDLPTASSVALTAARTLRRMLRQYTFTPEARAVLDSRLTILEATGTSVKRERSRIKAR